MATLTKFYQFAEDLGKAVHNFTSDATCTIVVALTNTAPTTADAVIGDITQISYTNCSSRIMTGVTFEQTGGIATLTLNPLTLTASGGSVGPFRYIVLYNSDTLSGSLIGFADYGSSITMADTETFDVNPSGGYILTVQ